MAVFEKEPNRLVFRFDAERLWIEPWGPNGLRVRSTKQAAMPGENWALLPDKSERNAIIRISETEASIRNGKITAVITKGGLITFRNSAGQKLLEEYSRNRRDLFARTCSALEVEAREFKPILCGDYHLTVRFESLDEQERIYGMGQYQQPYLNLKGAQLELAQRNSQASVPFALSSLGYGFLWNNPGVGRAVFGKNIMSFEAVSTTVMDYWVTAGDTPAEIVESYAAVTGTVPMMPDYGAGLWQSKLRYQTQEELLEVAREYARRKLPISVIVADFFHWPAHGDWKFDPVYWPDPEAMVGELKSMGIELMVSIWPTVEPASENYREMLERGLLIRVDRGVRTGLDFMAATIHLDATNPEAAAFIWQKAKKNYYDKGVRVFWLDEAEPEYTVYDFDNYRYFLGPCAKIGNIYPLKYAEAFFEGQRSEGQENIVNLLRCAWAGSQRYGALVWSGDIASSFESLRSQFAAGLNMGLAGIPWWTTDIGGFHGGSQDDPLFRELFIRWFQYGAFCPVMRMHGDREPKKPQHGETGGAPCLSGADNEVWSFGELAYSVCRKYIAIREQMRPYIMTLMAQAHARGTPVIRPLFYDFPEDAAAWPIEDQYMFGPSVLVAPIMKAGQESRGVYLPAGAKWLEYETGTIHDGGILLKTDAPLTEIPIFIRDCADVFNKPD